MTQTDIDRIKAYCEKATPGPWRLRTNDARQNIGVVMAEEIVSDYNPSHALVTLHATAWKPERWGNAKPNADFIANARTDLPLLVQQLDQLRKERDELLKDNEAAMHCLYDFLGWGPAICDCGHPACKPCKHTKEAELVVERLRARYDAALNPTSKDQP